MPGLGRALILAAHPDDEVIGMGATLAKLDEAFVVHVTDGAPRDEKDARANGFMSREDYAEARREESVAALRLAGIAERRLLALGYVDQEAMARLVEVTESVLETIRAIAPEMVVTHPYEGGHPDHDSTAFAVQCACALLERSGETSPFRLEYTSYHAGPAGPGGMTTGRFLELPSRPLRCTRSLDRFEQELKRRMFECFGTQAQVLRNFRRDKESFRAAPRYDFRQAPHPGRLFYESFDWGATRESWTAAAGNALERLGL